MPQWGHGWDDVKKHGCREREFTWEMTIIVLYMFHECVTVRVCVWVEEFDWGVWKWTISSQGIKEDTVKRMWHERKRDEAKVCLMSYNVMDPMGKKRPIETCNSYLVSSHSVVAVWEHIACNTLIEDENESAGEPSGVRGGERKVHCARRGRWWLHSDSWVWHGTGKQMWCDWYAEMENTTNQHLHAQGS